MTVTLIRCAFLKRPQSEEQTLSPPPIGELPIKRTTEKLYRVLCNRKHRKLLTISLTYTRKYLVKLCMFSGKNKRLVQGNLNWFNYQYNQADISDRQTKRTPLDGHCDCEKCTTECKICKWQCVQTTDKRYLFAYDKKCDGVGK